MNSALQIPSGPGAACAWDPDAGGGLAPPAHGNDVGPAAQASPDRIRADITAALLRHARREASRIAIDVAGGVVTLHGQVESRTEHDAAVGTARAAAGVARVVDRLEVTAPAASK